MKSTKPSPSKPACRDRLRERPSITRRKTLHAKRAYTCGHFPQSFEYSPSAAGSSPEARVRIPPTMARSKTSSYHKDTPRRSAIIVTSHYPREATGPSLNQIMMGSEGTFGVLTEVTLKVFRLHAREPQTLLLYVQRLPHRSSRLPRDDAMPNAGSPRSSVSIPKRPRS
jgi:hypothetical protein